MLAETFASRKTTVNVPSMFSPKRLVRTVFACSEPVPGTVSEVDRSPGRRTVESTPTATTRAQSTMTMTRWRTTARVQRSSMGAV